MSVTPEVQSLSCCINCKAVISERWDLVPEVGSLFSVPEGMRLREVPSQMDGRRTYCLVPADEGSAGLKVPKGGSGTAPPKPKPPGVHIYQTGQKPS